MKESGDPRLQLIQRYEENVSYNKSFFFGNVYIFNRSACIHNNAVPAEHVCVAILRAWFHDAANFENTILWQHLYEIEQKVHRAYDFLGILSLFNCKIKLVRV